MDHPTPTSRLVHESSSHCLHLRHKGMYVMSVPDPDYDNQLGATAYWCIHTLRGLGPDGQPVDPESCQHGRECCNR